MREAGAAIPNVASDAHWLKTVFQTSHFFFRNKTDIYIIYKNLKSFVS